MLLDINELKRVLHYDCETGIWTHILGNNKRLAGERADGRKLIKGREYRQVTIFEKQYLAHRLAWFYVHGTWPNKIDHKDRNPANNRLSNIRSCTQKQNCANRGIDKRNKAGLKGVFWVAERKKWSAQIKNGKSRYLGYFDCPAAAHFKYLIEADKTFGEFSCAG